MSKFLIIMQLYAEESSPIKVYGSPGCVPNLIDTISEFKREKMSWNLHFSFPSLNFLPSTFQFFSKQFVSYYQVTRCLEKSWKSKVFFSFVLKKKR